MTELLDIYDENLVWLGTKERLEVHRDGDLHRTFHCWIISRGADGRDRVLMQKRGPDKQVSPNLLDISAAGHYAAGESAADGVREIEEELGITVSFDRLIPVGIRMSIVRQGDVVDYEFNEVFFLIDDRPLTDYRFQADEISGLVRFEIDDALALFAGERERFPAQAVGLGADVIELSKSDFIPTPDNYTYRTLILAKRCLNGEKHLVI